MSTERRSLIVPSAVYLGAVILIGLPATAVLSVALTGLLEAIGLDAVTESAVGGLVILAVALGLGLQLAVEAAAIQLGGLEALERGSPRMTLARHLVLAAAVFLALAAVTVFALSAAFAEYGLAIGILGALVGLTGLAVLYRASSAFLDGLQGND